MKKKKLVLSKKIIAILNSHKVIGGKITQTHCNEWPKIGPNETLTGVSLK